MEIDCDFFFSLGFCYGNSIIKIKENVFMKTKVFDSDRFDSIKLIWK